MNKIVVLQPGVVFVSADWESTLVPAYDTRAIAVSLGVNGREEEKKEEDTQLPDQGTSSA
jgi:hypothetical protein